MKNKLWFNRTWSKIVSIGVILGIIVGSIQIYKWYVSPDSDIQLTVFVTDENGNVVLENEGELNIPIGNRSLNKPIGLNGRTNFADITEKQIGNVIEIGFKADGWVLVSNNNTFKFTGEPIHLKVKKDDKLGLVYGIVTSRDGQTLIEGVKLLFDNGEEVITDSSGKFRTIMPKQVRVDSEEVFYSVKVIKDGFETIDKYCFPNQFCDIRMDVKYE